jgi:hypothetical protein
MYFWEAPANVVAELIYLVGAPILESGSPVQGEGYLTPHAFSVHFISPICRQRVP